MTLNEKMKTLDEEKFKYYSLFDGVIETGLEFHVDEFYPKYISNKKDNYNVPLEYIRDEEDTIEVPLISEEVSKTYQKVVEVYEMNEAEINVVNKIRYVLKLIFEGFFRGNNVHLWCAGISYGFIAYDLIIENYFAALVMFTYSLLYTDLKIGIKTLKEYFTSERRKDFEQYLEKYVVLKYTNAMKKSDDVKMYIKTRRNEL